jgi:hypothetical protein
MIAQRLKRWLSMILIVTCLTSFTACGYFLYPERRGQEGGRIDPVVALLDAALLLLFIVPGVVAFAVDITTGTIYLPDGRTGELAEVRLDRAGRLDTATLERILSGHLGKTVSLDPETTLFFDAQGRTPHELKAILEALNAGIRDQAVLERQARAFELRQAFM